MDNDNKRWKQFQRIKLDRKSLLKRVKHAETRTIKHADKFLLRRIENIRLVRREITIWLTMIGVIIAALGVQLMAGQQNYMIAAPASGGSYVEGSLGPIDTINPIYASTSAEASIGRLVFSSLYNYDHTGSIHQDLATANTIDQSGCIYTVKIRDDVSWHDGKKLTAKDVVFTVNLMKNPATRSPLRVNWLDVSARVLDEVTIEFTLPVTYAAFPHALTFPVLPEHLLVNVAPGALRESPYSQSPVGSGPFKFKLLQSGDAVRNLKAVHLTANDAFYDGRPKLDRFEIQAYEKEDDIISALRAGEISGATDISVTLTEKVSKKAYTLTPQPLDSGVYTLLNSANPLLQDIKVRQALQAATDTSALRDTLGGGLKPLDSPFVDGQLTGADVPHTPPADVVKANSLLDQAGWTKSAGIRKKDNQELRLVITTTRNAEYEKALTILKEQWARIGVKVDSRIVDTSSVSSNFIQDTLQARNFDVLLYELAIGADPDVYAYWHSSQIGQSGYNFASYSNKNADANLASARSRLEPELRNAKYKLFAKQWIEDAPAIALYQPVVDYISSKNASTVEPGSHLVTPLDRYANVLDWTITRETVYKTP